MPVQTPFCCSVCRSKIVGFLIGLCVLSKMHKCIRQKSPGLYLIASFTQSDWVNDFFPDNLDNFLSADKTSGFLLNIYQGKLH